MKFDELEAKMRVFETANDHVVLPEIYIVARIDGRGFTRLTKEVHGFSAPFDERFRDMMVATGAHLMDCGFRIVFGYTQSDEISLLFHQGESTFGRTTTRHLLALGLIVDDDRVQERMLAHAARAAGRRC